MHEAHFPDASARSQLGGILTQASPISKYPPRQTEQAPEEEVVAQKAIFLLHIPLKRVKPESHDKHKILPLTVTAFVHFIPASALTLHLFNMVS